MHWIGLTGDRTPDTTGIGDAVRYLETECGYTVPPTTPLAGAQAFSTAAGIHADGLLKDPAVYLPFDPERLLGLRPGITITDRSAAGVAAWWQIAFGETIAKDDPRVRALAAWVQARYDEGRTTAVSDAELRALAPFGLRSPVLCLRPHAPAPCPGSRASEPMPPALPPLRSAHPPSRSGPPLAGSPPRPAYTRPIPAGRRRVEPRRGCSGSTRGRSGSLAGGESTQSRPGEAPPPPSCRVGNGSVGEAPAPRTLPRRRRAGRWDGSCCDCRLDPEG